MLILSAKTVPIEIWKSLGVPLSCGDYPISFEHTSDDEEDDLSLTNDVAIEEESDLDR